MMDINIQSLNFRAYKIRDQKVIVQAVQMNSGFIVWIENTKEVGWPNDYLVRSGAGIKIVPCAEFEKDYEPITTLQEYILFYCALVALFAIMIFLIWVVVND